MVVETTTAAPPRSKSIDLDKPSTQVQPSWVQSSQSEKIIKECIRARRAGVDRCFPVTSVELDKQNAETPRFEENVHELIETYASEKAKATLRSCRLQAIASLISYNNAVPPESGVICAPVNQQTSRNFSMHFNSSEFVFQNARLGFFNILEAALAPPNNNFAGDVCCVRIPQKYIEEDGLTSNFVIIKTDKPSTYLILAIEIGAYGQIVSVKPAFGFDTKQLKAEENKWLETCRVAIY